MTVRLDHGPTRRGDLDDVTDNVTEAVTDHVTEAVAPPARQARLGEPPDQ